MSARKLSIRQSILLLPGLILVIFLLDALCGDVGLNVYGDVIPTEANRLWSAVWFSEAMGFIVLPLVLVAYQKRKSLSLLPAIAASVVTLFFATSMVSDEFTQQPDTWHNQNPLTTTYRILHSTIPYQFTPGNDDPLLVSSITPFLIGQIPFVTGLAVGSGLLYGVRKYRNR